MNKSMRFAGVFLALALLALPGAAQSLELEAFRADLLAYTRALGGLPAGLTLQMGIQPESLAQAESSIAALSDAELAALKEQMDKVPYWRQVPTLLQQGLWQAAMSGSPGTVLSPRDLAFEMALASRGLDVEGVRGSLLGLVRSFRGVPADLAPPGYFDRIARVEAALQAASGEQLLGLTAEIERQAPAWAARLEEGYAAAQAGTPLEGSVSVMGHCASGFAGVICEIGHIINTIAGFPAQIATFATNAVNSIKESLLTFLRSIGPALEGAVDWVVGQLGNIDWNSVISVIDTHLRLPCPPDDFLLPGFGRVGDIRTAVYWDRGIGFAGNTIAAVMPGDILTSLDLQIVAHILNFPVQWVSRCLNSAYEEKFDLAQERHREHVETNLDVTASSRASQTSVDGAAAQVVNIDGDVGKVEAKLDSLDGTLDRVENGTITLNATLDSIENRTESVLDQSDDIESRTETLIEGTNTVETKVDHLQVQQNQTNDILFNLRMRLLRMLIEADLYRNANERIGLFQLPQEGTMGFLEMARAIVADTLSRRAAAGDSLGQAQKWLADGDDQYNHGNYKAAYTSYRRAYQTAIN